MTSMRLPFLKDLKTVVLGRALPLLRPMYSIRSEALVDAFPGHYAPDIKMRTEVRLFQEYVSREGASADETAMHRKMTVRHICRAIYGGMEDELHEASRELWEIGVPSDSPAMQRLGRLIESCRGNIDEMETP